MQTLPTVRILTLGRQAFCPVTFSQSAEALADFGRQGSTETHLIEHLAYPIQPLVNRAVTIPFSIPDIVNQTVFDQLYAFVTHMVSINPSLVKMRLLDFVSYAFQWNDIYAHRTLTLPVYIEQVTSNVAKQVISLVKARKGSKGKNPSRLMAEDELTALLRRRQMVLHIPFLVKDPSRTTYR